MEAQILLNNLEDKLSQMPDHVDIEAEKLRIIVAHVKGLEERLADALGIIHAFNGQAAVMAQ